MEEGLSLGRRKSESDDTHNEDRIEGKKCS